MHEARDCEHEWHTYGHDLGPDGEFTVQFCIFCDKRQRVTGYLPNCCVMGAHVGPWNHSDEQRAMHEARMLTSEQIAELRKASEEWINDWEVGCPLGQFSALLDAADKWNGVLQWAELNPLMPILAVVEDLQHA